VNAPSRGLIALGRALALGTVVVGIAVTGFDAHSLPDFGFPHYKLRSFLAGALYYVWFGSLLLALTEIVAAFGGEPARGRLDWNIPVLIKALGCLVVLGGIALAVWHVGSGPNGLAVLYNDSFYPASRREAAHTALTGAWRGSLLFLAAELAQRIGARTAADVVIDEPPPDASTEPTELTAAPSQT